MKKSLDNAETNAILLALVDQGVDASCVRTLANCCDRCTTKIQLFHLSLTIPIIKGIRQGDTISPKLFMAALQWIMKSLSWKEKGIGVDGRFLSNLISRPTSFSFRAVPMKQKRCSTDRTKQGRE